MTAFRLIFLWSDGKEYTPGVEDRSCMWAKTPWSDTDIIVNQSCGVGLFKGVAVVKNRRNR